MDFNQAIQKIEEKLSQRQPLEVKSGNLIPSAVLIPLLNIKNEAHILFTLRTNTVEHHKGQISFPGGARDEEDESLEQTALRECYEEVGIPPEVVTIIGRFDDFPTVTNFLVTPFVATIPYPYPQKINRQEVETILEVPLSLFLSDEHFEIKNWEHEGKKYPVYFYYFNNHIIWGATAFIFNRFVEEIFDYNPAPQSISCDPRFEDYLRENRTRKGKI